jgi:diaminohydroxyphosphoribosylaminopyrimidine deaminase/5-amino-6-(5-phosphoribosylamino)uracil reductase
VQFPTGGHSPRASFGADQVQSLSRQSESGREKAGAGLVVRCSDDPWANRLRGSLLDSTDLAYLERALDLAQKGRGCTSPNPIVGALIVRQGETIGEGWHAGAGLDHAEVAALRDALRRAGRPEAEAPGELDKPALQAVCAGATMYVTLEPCCTQGRTPPCTSALTKASVARVVVAAVDPSPAVNGRGLRLLTASGIAVEVVEGPLALSAKRQNNGLRKFVTRGMPFVHYKYAMTLDGRSATDSGDSKWISSAESRALVHKWRAWSDAVVVGAGTVAADDPTLTAREVGCMRQPLRVVVEKHCALSATSNLVRTVSEGPVLVICGEESDKERLAKLRESGVETAVVGLDHTCNLDPEQVCRLLAERGVQSVLLEGGARLAGAWWSAGVIDQVSAFVCPRIVSGQRLTGPLVGPGAADMQQALGLQEVEVCQAGADVLISGYTGGPF